MPQEPDVHFTPVPERVLVEMLRIAEVGPEDVVYDLGCGDGRVIIAAALTGARRAVGVDIDAARVAESIERASAAGVGDRVEFREEDFFDTDLKPATVLALYLLDSLNVRLRPKILAECATGTRVVTYSFEMGDWECDAHTPIAANGVSLWVVPANVTGRWEVDMEGASMKTVTLEQRFQRLTGTVEFSEGVFPIRNGSVRGVEFSFVVEGPAGGISVSGRIEGERMEGSLIVEGTSCAWRAKRVEGTRQVLQDGVSRP
jgi:SAM-dependent methyltransferase